MRDHVYGDKIGRDKYTVNGDHATFTVGGTNQVSRAEPAAAVAELRAFIALLTRDGVIAEDGTVIDPGALVTAVEARPGRWPALTAALAGGARDAVISAAQSGAASLIVALAALVGPA
ncbi:hypothetical protein ACFT5C_04450 [Streptomyces sp. NPDC057116]|uniref:hypothetical protein n=1 Tax=Streptomyces sp. NPDC057116 TaxID=3346023 RepID=UPI00362896CE